MSACHRTLKQAATRSPGRSLADQQLLLDQFRHEYNQERPHETLQQQTPASHYHPSLRPYTETPEELIYPGYYVIRRVQQSGLVGCRGKIIYVSHLLKGHPVGLVEVAEGVWDVYFGPVRLGGFDERQAKGEIPYLTLKSVTHVP